MRIRVKDVLDLLAAGVPEQEILADFPDLEAGDIRACLAEAETLRQALWDGIFAEVPEELWQPIGMHAKIQGG